MDYLFTFYNLNKEEASKKIDKLDEYTDAFKITFSDGGTQIIKKFE